MTAEEAPGGRAAAVAAFVMWGVLPVYWKALGAFPPLLVVAHRVCWSWPILLAVLALLGRLEGLAAVWRRPRLLLLHACAAALLATNWWLYILATLTGRILEGSLGYFLNPIMSFALGWFLLGERPGGRQRLAAAVAMAGVCLQVLALAAVPWIALALALSFSLYGFLRKQSALGALAGTTLETGLVLPPALLLLAAAPGFGFGGASPGESALLAGAGLATLLPLLCFAFAARRIPLSTLGMLQFIGPTLQFLIGRFVYDEPLPPLRLASFALIWAGLALYLLPARRAPGPVIP
jgi:chloramphenicol-sensitive protein RarD